MTFPILAFASLSTALLGCATTGPETTDSVVDTGPTDADEDGVMTPDDCDDSRADVYPGAEDANGDSVDADCDGVDGLPFVGCSPILIPDTYATIGEALAAGEFNLCLGEGTFSHGPLPEGARNPSAFRGQGRDLTFVTDPSAHYEVHVLAGLTATGAVSGSGSYSFNDVTLENATVSGFDNFLCDRCALINSPIDVAVEERIAGIALSDCWITGADEGVRLELTGCSTGCSGYYTDLRMYNMTFTGNKAAISMDLAGDYDIYFVAENSIFLDNGAVMTVKTHAGQAPRFYPDGNGNVEWSEGNEPFPDDYELETKEQDPELDLAYSPPRPREGSPMIDKADSDATLIDFWGTAREDADKGAVER